MTAQRSVSHAEMERIRAGKRAWQDEKARLLTDLLEPCQNFEPDGPGSRPKLEEELELTDAPEAGIRALRVCAC